MGNRLEGKVAWVNGGGSSAPGWGHGKASAVQFAREGASVLVADIDLAAAQETVDIIAREGGRALAVQADVASEADMQRAARAGLDAFGRLDILMQVVGISTHNSFFDETEAGWNRVFAVNLNGAYFASRAALPSMLERRWGRIITVSSIAGLRVLRKGMPFGYGVSKAALIHFTKHLAAEFADQGVRCNALSLGMMDTDVARDKLGPHAEEMCRQRDAATPTGKQGTAWDTAHVAAFLASDEANYLNGLDLVVDAGFINQAPGVRPGR
jgi:NAD(P)-dependent dehydrogenase (short-subunit alcohol dehydrogenase family)